MIGTTCSIDGCEDITYFLSGSCEACDARFCPIHDTETHHTCAGLSRDAKLAKWTSKIHERMHQVMLETKKKVLRDFPGYKVELPSRPQEVCGQYNIHLPVTDLDGKKWLARARYSPLSVAPQHFLNMWNESEAATLTFLATAHADAKIPRILAPDTLEDYFLIEYMEGSPAAAPILAENFAEVERKDVFREFARHYIALSGIRLPRVGGLHFGDTRDAHDVKVGAWSDRKGIDSSGTSHRTVADNYTARINDILHSLEMETTPTPKVTGMYWAHLEMRRIVNHPKAGMSTSASEYYVAHGEPKGDHFLLKDGRLTGVLDWDWAFTTSKDEAFTAGTGFMDFDRFIEEGSNELSESERLLKEAYTELGREDLAECVRNGKKFQRLWTMVGIQGDLISIKGLQAACGLEVDEQETWEDWCKMAALRFKGEIAADVFKVMNPC